MKNPALHFIQRATAAAAIAVIFVFSAFGQSNTGSITGVIADQNGAVVPNATVTVTNQGTNEKRTVQADGVGRYDVPSLPTGIYTIEASGSGFTTSSVKGLRLAVGERARADVTLAAGGVDNGKPGLRPQYHPNYYGAYVRDPDGHNIEAVCHAPK